jgi:hypothetical protein
MSADTSLARDVDARQIQMFAMFVGQGLITTRAALAAASGISTSTLKSWADGASMPLYAVLHLRRFLPREATNMLTEPGGVRMTDIDHAASSWDGIAASASGLVAEFCEAKRDGTINHVEAERLRLRGRGLVAELSEVVETG